MSENPQQDPVPASAGHTPAGDPGATGTPQAPATRRRRTILLFWLGFAALAYVCDQLTKLWVTSTMVEGQTTPVIPGILQWYYIRNSGAAFSIGEDYTWFFTLIMAAVSVFIIVLARRIGSIWWGIGLGLLLGGALGNLTDRLFRPPSFAMGHVVDFISFPNFAIFNMADMGVVGGVITICILTLVGIPLGGRKAVPATIDGGEPAGETESEAGQHD
ncbi:MAG: signal peptidase II [Specibacter sp.]